LKIEYLRHWIDFGLPWCDLSGISCGAGNSSKEKRVEQLPYKIGLGQGIQILDCRLGTTDSGSVGGVKIEN